jgi:nicotinate phosphoribosyltransferase
MPHARPEHPSPILFTDLYELTMLQAYLEEGQHDEAVFSLFVRRLPERRNFLLTCGLDTILHFLETARFDRASLDYLATVGVFTDRFLRSLEAFRFEGDVYAVPEGTPMFGNEPLIEIVAPLPQGQLVETFLLNQITLQTTLASKAARVIAAARGRVVVDFGLRRMHGLDAGLKSARVFHIAGLAGTSNLAAGQVYGVPVYGTMAHSYIQAHEDEYRAFRAFASLYPDTTLLVDTYDTLGGVRHVVQLARELSAHGEQSEQEQGDSFRVRAIRLDSGDLAELSRAARRMLDEAGLQRVQIFASGGLDEERIDRLLTMNPPVPIDGFGVGSDLAVSSDAPSLDAVYKLVSYRGRGRTKLSAGKGVLPGRKQVYRIEADGVAVRDVIAQADESIEMVRGELPGELPGGLPGGLRSGEQTLRPLLVQVMRRGERVDAGRESLDRARDRAKEEIARLPAYLRAIAATETPYAVDVSAALSRAHRALIVEMSSAASL